MHLLHKKKKTKIKTSSRKDSSSRQFQLELRPPEKRDEKRCEKSMKKIEKRKNKTFHSL